MLLGKWWWVKTDLGYLVGGWFNQLLQFEGSFHGFVCAVVEIVVFVCLFEVKGLCIQHVHWIWNHGLLPHSLNIYTTSNAPKCDNDSFLTPYFCFWTKVKSHITFDFFCNGGTFQPLPKCCFCQIAQPSNHPRQKGMRGQTWQNFSSRWANTCGVCCMWRPLCCFAGYMAETWMHLHCKITFFGQISKMRKVKSEEHK